MVKTFKESKSSQRWLGFAKHDLDIAFQLNKDEAFTDTVCYFCHQATEKTLKSFLLAVNIKDFPHIHNLKKLLDSTAKIDAKMEDFQQEVEILNKYFIETKYPADFPIDYSREETDKALGMAQEIYEFVKNKLNPLTR